MTIYYSDEDGRLTEEIKTLMEAAAAKAIELEFDSELRDADMDASEVDAEVSVTVVSGDEIRELNRDYRGKDSVTDVLSFPQFDDYDELVYDLIENEYTTLLGDVVLCYDRAVSQAEEYGTGITRELVYLFVHSILHLMGYDHEEEDDKIIMRAREEQIMGAIGVVR
ncbi:MAG: rRNA maturation RNase YbeY [Mogibacterium sp.]|nr:rRNA maturation RNase YbeY [Mogibacterium sp.]